MPPHWVRRILVAPVVPLIAIAWIVFLPLSIPAVAFATRFLPGRLRPLRLVWVLLVVVVRESLGLLLLLGLWILSGFGWRLRTAWFQRQHVNLIGWYLWGLIGTAQQTLGLRMVTESSAGALVVEPHVPPRPVLVFSRHAGVGDSVLLTHEIVNTYGRHPSIVLKDSLQWAPCLDIVLNRIPNRFIPPGLGSGVVESIGALAAELPLDGALILFPEGGNFTDERRRQAIERLVKRGLHAEAAKARNLVTVLPPRPGGVFAALDAAPEADVVFVAHTGLERLSSLREVLAGIPMEHSVRMAWWLERAEAVPQTEPARIAWLYEWWEKIDTWIQGHAEVGLEPVAHVSQLPDRSQASSESTPADNEPRWQDGNGSAER